MRFNNGSQVEYEDCDRCEGTGKLKPVMKHAAVIIDERTCDRCGGEKVLLLVTRPAGGTARYRFPDDAERAYRMALEGPPPAPSAVTGKWYLADNPRLDRFGDCPF